MAKQTTIESQAPEEKKKTQQRAKKVLTDEDRENQYVSADVYALLSTEAGHTITYQAVNERIKAGTITVTKLTGVEGYFIDLNENPFGKLKRGPKNPRKPKQE